MLPTLEILKLRHPSIYDPSLLCLRCDAADENFYHIWMCPTVNHEMKKIIQQSKIYLKDITYAHDHEIDQLNVWLLDTYNTSEFFVLIRGIVPVPLFKFFQKKFSSQSLALAACSSFMHLIFELTQNVWRDCCQHVHNFEQSSNITLASKTANFVTSGYDLSSNPFTHSFSSPPISSMVRMGTHWSNFWCSSGLALSAILQLFTRNMIFLA